MGNEFGRRDIKYDRRRPGIRDSDAERIYIQQSELDEFRVLVSNGNYYDAVSGICSGAVSEEPVCKGGGVRR